jgi:pyridoxamine 5'-phosphate oxidase
MTLATASPDGAPAARTVLLKAFDAQGFVFYTNYESQKGKDLAANPRATLLFCWLALERQVRIDGNVARVSREESEAYFHSRPIGSQYGAWASRQSSVVENREALDAKLREVEQQYAGQTVPLPPYWGGYRVTPTMFEFWQGRENRMHDRLRYRRNGDGWKIERLSP